MGRHWSRWGPRALSRSYGSASIRTKEFKESVGWSATVLCFTDWSETAWNRMERRCNAFADNDCGSVARKAVGRDLPSGEADDVLNSALPDLTKKRKKGTTTSC
jgi:hypothetical protein